MSIKSLSVRLDEDMLHKLHYIADYEGRSANGQITVMVRSLIERFEEKYGEIPINKAKK
ncbi:MAG: hypothetical protein IJF48_02495 [Clostridia bacterium]|nr:hypothetical protein [Clostridia bacterium]